MANKASLEPSRKTPAAAPVTVHVHTLASMGGVRIAVRDYATPTQASLGSVVVACAMGVRQDFYAPLARWLAQQGWRVTTFDYRGSGDSLPDTAHGGLRGFQADLLDWARDFEAVVDHVHHANPKQPLVLLGHSLGAQLPGLMANTHKVSGLLGVATGSGYWRENAPQLKRSVLFFWYFLVPVFTRLFGYFPGKRLGAVGDLPAGVIRQWRRWCLNPRYSVGAEGETARQSYAEVRFPVLALSVTDDEMMTHQGLESLMALYTNAPRQVQRLAPADVAVRRLGHFGAFRSEHQAVLWPRIHQFLSGLSQPAPV